MRVTLRDVAAKCGYAVSTVSHVLNNRSSCYISGLGRERIFRTARELGYHPDFFARALRNKHSGLIGVASALFSYQPHIALLQSIRSCLRKRGYIAFFTDIGFHAADVAEPLEELARMNVEGVLLLSDVPCPEAVEEMAARLPMVAVSPFAARTIPTLLLDQRAAVERLVERLAASGRDRMIFLTWNRRGDVPKLAGFEAATSRLALSAQIHEIAEEDAAVLRFVRDHETLFDGSAAVLTGHDRLAAELLRALQETGLSAPRDCAVAGFADTEIARLVTPQLTSVRPPREEVGTQAVEMLLDRVAGRSVEGRVLVPEVVERESTAVALDLVSR